MAGGTLIPAVSKRRAQGSFTVHGLDTRCWRGLGYDGYLQHTANTVCNHKGPVLHLGTSRAELKIMLEPAFYNRIKKILTNRSSSLVYAPTNKIVKTCKRESIIKLLKIFHKLPPHHHTTGSNTQPVLLITNDHLARPAYVQHVQ